MAIRNLYRDGDYTVVNAIVVSAGWHAFSYEKDGAKIEARSYRLKIARPYSDGSGRTFDWNVDIPEAIAASLVDDIEAVLDSPNGKVLFSGGQKAGRTVVKSLDIDDGE